MKLRKFQFFSYHEVLEKSTRNSFSLLKDTKIAYITSGKEYIIVADSNGTIYALDRILSTFPLNFGAFSSCVIYMHMSVKVPLLVCVGNDHGEARPILRVFDLKTKNNSGIPFCTRQLKLACPEAHAIASTAIVHPRLNQLALGFSSGAILILTGDVAGKRNLKETELKKFNTPITGLKYVIEESETFLFATTLDAVACIDLNSFNVSILDSVGCNPNCCAVIDVGSDQDFYVASESALTCYSSVGPTKCIPLPGQKGLMRAFNNNLVLIIKETKHRTRETRLDSLQIVSIEDKMKYISFSKEVPRVADVISVWGSLYVLLTSGQLFELVELELENKVKVLFSKNLFDLAISLTRRHADRAALDQVVCRFGDYLYARGDFEQAMGQYSQTIDTIEPSYVVMKFLDAQNIHYLSSYLEHLHQACRANSDHTTLLLNCYIRLKNTQKLDSFLKGDADWHFDIETALRVCHHAGLTEQALFLAKRAGRHIWYLKIQLEDVKDYRSALEYLKNLSVSEAETVLKNYGRRLLKDTPKELVEYLKLICTPSEQNPTPCSPENFIHIFIQQRDYLRLFLEHVLEVDKNCSNQIYNTLLELYIYKLASDIPEGERQQIEAKCLHLMQHEEGKYDIDHVLMLCQLNNFVKGLVALYEKMQKFSMIIQYRMDIRDFEGIVRDCTKYGDREPELWLMALEFFTKNYDECEEYLVAIVDKANLSHAIAPVDLINILAQSDKTQVRLVKHYITEHFDSANAIIMKNIDEIAKKRQEIEKTKRDIAELKLGTKVFQNSKCSLCETALEMPVIHFMCGHSYHQFCAESIDQEGECVICFEKVEAMESSFQPNCSEQELVNRFEKEVIWVSLNRSNVVPIPSSLLSNT